MVRDDYLSISVKFLTHPIEIFEVVHEMSINESLERAGSHHVASDELLADDGGIVPSQFGCVVDNATPFGYAPVLLDQGCSCELL